MSRIKRDSAEAVPAPKKSNFFLKLTGAVVFATFVGLVARNLTEPAAAPVVRELVHMALQKAKATVLPSAEKVPAKCDFVAKPGEKAARGYSDSDRRALCNLLTPT